MEYRRSGYDPNTLRTLSFAELDAAMAQEKRIVVAFIHTDWCKICQQMKSTTFHNEQVIQTLNDHFYFVDLNAESTDDITFSGHTFQFKPTGANTGVHELAEQLGTINGELNFPTISILNPQTEIIFQHGGYLDTQEMLAVLNELTKE